MTVHDVITKHAKQTAVHWAKTGTTGVGASSYGSPSEISVNWQEKLRQVPGEGGEIVLSTGSVFTVSDLTVGDYLYLGDLNDLDSSTVGPEDVSDCRKIIARDKTPNRFNNEYSRRYYLE